MSDELYYKLTCYEFPSRDQISPGKPIKEVELQIYEYVYDSKRRLRFPPDLLYGTTDPWSIEEQNETMMEMSQEFPTILFRVYNEDPRSFARWSRYYLNGKMQLCKTICTEEHFDESKLE